MPVPADDTSAVVHLVHLNDTEGAVADVWPRLVTALRTLRAQGRLDVLLHAGDVPLGAPSGEVAVRLMNRLGVDAVALGNHDLDDGVPAFAAQAARLRAPVLCANVSGLPAGCVRPYCLPRRRGLRIAVVGVTLGDLLDHMVARYTVGLTVRPPAEALNDLVPWLRRRADLVVVLSHCSYASDVVLANQVAGISVIVGGHSHHLITTPVCAGDAWVVQAGASGAYVGWLAARREGRLTVSGGVVPTAQLQPDARTLAECASVRILSPIVGYTAVTLTSPTYARETALGNLTADVMRAAAGTDLALLRCGTVNISFPAGPIHHDDLRMLNFCGADQVARLRLTGAEIRAILEHGARSEYFLLTTSGARVAYDATRLKGQRVVTIEVGSESLWATREYTVACSEVLAHGVSGFPCLRDKPRELVPHTIVDLLTRHIVAHSPIQPRIDGRLTIYGELPGEALGKPDAS